MTERSRFPILRSLRDHRAKRASRSIPWAVIQPHEQQALRNHDQSLARLAERGGLSACEAVAVLEDRKWREMDPDVAEARLTELVVALETL